MTLGLELAATRLEDRSLPAFIPDLVSVIPGGGRPHDRDACGSVKLAGNPSDLNRRPPVSPTSVILLDRLKVARPDASDWDRLHGVYLPPLRGWLGRVPGLGDEVADLA